MRRLSKIFFALLMTVFASAAFAACTQKYAEQADITITVMPSAASVTVASADGQEFSVSGNVYTLKNVPVKSYQISIVSKDDAAEKYAPQVIDIPMSELTDGSYSQTVEMESAKEYFVAEITLQSANATATVEGLGAEWTKTNNKFRAKVEKSAVEASNLFITAKMDNCESRTITVNQKMLDAGYYFGSVRLGLSTKSYKTYTLTGPDYVGGMDEVSVISLNTGKKYNAQPQRTWLGNSMQRTTLWLELDRNDYIQVSFINGGKRYAEKFLTSQTYLDDIDLSPVADDSLEKIYYHNSFYEYTNIYYFKDGKYLLAEKNREYSQQGMTKIYISVPENSDLYIFQAEGKYIPFGDGNGECWVTVCYKAVFKNPSSSAQIRESDFKFYDSEDNIIDRYSAEPEEVTLKFKDVLTDEYIDFDIAEDGTPETSKVVKFFPAYAYTDGIGTSLFDQYLYDSNISTLDMIRGAQNSVYECMVLPLAIDFSVNVNTLGIPVTVSSERQTEEIDGENISVDYDIVQFYDDYLIININVYDELSSKAIDGRRAQDVYIWYDSFEDADYELDIWFSAFYQFSAKLMYNGSLFKYERDSGMNYLINTSNENFDQNSFNIHYEYDYQTDSPKEYYIIFEILPEFEADISLTVHYYATSSRSEKIYNLKLASLDFEQYDSLGYLAFNITFVREINEKY